MGVLRDLEWDLTVLGTGAPFGLNMVVSGVEGDIFRVSCPNVTKLDLSA
jgi:hypothetical protein